MHNQKHKNPQQLVVSLAKCLTRWCPLGWLSWRLPRTFSVLPFLSFSAVKITQSWTTEIWLPMGKLFKTLVQETHQKQGRLSASTPRCYRDCRAGQKSYFRGERVSRVGNNNGDSDVTHMGYSFQPRGPKHFEGLSSHTCSFKTMIRPSTSGATALSTWSSSTDWILALRIISALLAPGAVTLFFLVSAGLCGEAVTGCSSFGCIGLSVTLNCFNNLALLMFKNTQMSDHNVQTLAWLDGREILLSGCPFWFMRSPGHLQIFAQLNLLRPLHIGCIMRLTQRLKHCTWDALLFHCKTTPQKVCCDAGNTLPWHRVELSFPACSIRCAKPFRALTCWDLWCTDGAWGTPSSYWLLIWRLTRAQCAPPSGRSPSWSDSKPRSTRRDCLPRSPKSVQSNQFHPNCN